MSQAKANCKFCSKTDNSIQVICETRCLICSRCQLMPGIRKLLLDHTNANNIPSDFPISNGTCPLCDAAMSPSMLILITTFRDAFKKLQCDENSNGRLGSEIELEEVNNLIPNFLKRFRNTYENVDGKAVDNAPTSGPVTATKRYNATVVDIYETYAAPTKANAQTALEFLVDCFYAQWMGIIRNNNESMVAIFMRLSNKKKFSTKTNDFKAKSLIDFLTSSGGYETQDILLFSRMLGLQPKLTNNISAAWSHIAVAIQVASHCDRCLKFGQLNDGQGNPSATELRQKMVKNTYNPKVISLKKAIKIIALLSQVKHPYWTMSPLSPACIEFNCQYPWSPESVSKLLNILFYVTLYDPALPPPPSSPSLGTRRASSLPPLTSQHNLLAEIQQQQQQQQQALLQPQDSFLTQTPSLTLPNGQSSVAAGAAAAAPTAQELAVSAAMLAQYKTNARVGMLRNLEHIVKRMWGASANSNMSKSTNKTELLFYFNRIDQQRNHYHYARMTYEKAMSLVDNQTILVSELALLCIECWDCEYARTKLTISKGKITSQRRMAFAGKYDSSMAQCTAVERLAIIRLLHWYSHEGESRGVDWEDVEVNYKERAFPFLVPDSLMEKSRNELNYLSEKLWASMVAQNQKDREEDRMAESGPYSTQARGVRTFGNSQMIYGNSLNADDYVSYEDIARYNREQYLANQSLGYDPEEFEGWVDPETLPKDEIIVHGAGGERETYTVDTPSHHSGHHHHHGHGHHHGHHHHHHHHHHNTHTLGDNEAESRLIAGSDAVDRDSEEILQRAAAAASHSTSRLPSAGTDTRPKTPLSGVAYESPHPGTHTMNMVDMLDVGTNVLTNAKLIENSYENQALHKAEQNPDHFPSGVSITSVEKRINSMEIQDLTQGQPYKRHDKSAQERRALREAEQLREDKEVDEMYEKGQEQHVRSKILVARSKIRSRQSGRDSAVSLSLATEPEPSVAAGGGAMAHSPEKLAAAAATLDAASMVSSTTALTDDNFASFTHYNADEYSHCRVNQLMDLSHLVDKNGVFEMDLASTLSCENAVKYLRLRNTRIAAKGLQKFADHFLKQWQLDKLIRLDLNDNLTLATAGAKVLSSKLSACCRLIHLNLANCNVGDIGFRSLMSAVLNGGGMSCLLRLDLSGNNVTMVSDSFAVIGKLYNLRALDLSHNKITLDTRAQGQLFLTSMAELTQLEAFSIAYNKIQNDGFSLIYSLVSNHYQNNLRILDIAGCFITSKSFAGLVKLLNACGEPPEDAAEEPERQKLRLEEVLFQDNLLSYAQLQEIIVGFAKRVGIKISLNKPHLGIKYPLCYDMKEYGLDEYHV